MHVSEQKKKFEKASIISLFQNKELLWELIIGELISRKIAKDYR